MTASARASPWATGSRNGPAGMQRPLPNPAPASTARSDRSLASPGFWNPSSSTIASAPAATAARAPDARSAETQTGAKAASSSGSSPVTAASSDRETRCGGPLPAVPPWPRVTQWAATPSSASACSTAMAVGVLPAPPAVRLPMQITGTGAVQSGARATRRAVAAA